MHRAPANLVLGLSSAQRILCSATAQSHHGSPQAPSALITDDTARHSGSSVSTAPGPALTRGLLQDFVRRAES